MIDAMMESRVATSAATHLVEGLGEFRYIDLDTPLLSVGDPFTGGYEQRGVVYDVSSVQSGLGIERDKANTNQSSKKLLDMHQKIRHYL